MPFGGEIRARAGRWLSDVDVDVADPLIVAPLVNRNDTVGV